MHFGAATNKPPLDWDTLTVLDGMAKEVKALPEGEEKERAKINFQKIHSWFLEKNDMPARVIAPDAIAAKIVDYPAGIVRTAVGETARAAQAGVDAVKGTPNAWSPSSAGKNILDALAPIGRDPAKPSQYYLDQMGVPPGPSVADLPGASKVGINKGGPLDFTARGVGGFMGDMAMTPGNVGRLATMGDQAENKFATGSTAAELQAEKAASDEAARNAGAPGMAQGLRQFGGGLKDMMMDPANKIARSLHDWRYRFADEAAQLKGKPLPSQIMWDAQGKGITTKGIRADMEKVLAGNESAIDDLMNDPQVKASLRNESPDRLTVPRGSPSDAGNQVPSANSALFPLWSPEQQALESNMVRGAGAQQARASIENQVRQAEATRPGLQNIHADAKAQAGMPLQTTDATGQPIPLYEQPPTITTKVRPHAQLGDQTLTTTNGTQAVGADPGEFDALNYDRPITFDEVQSLRRGAQSEAKTRNWYNRRQSGVDPFYPGDPKNMEAEAGLWANMAGHASGLENSMLDEAKPGAGGEAYLRNQDSSALLEGGPWLDRAPKTGATRRSQLAFAPFEGRMLNMAEDAAGGAAMAGSNVLKNPWMRLMAAPAARSAWINSIYDRMNTPTVNAMGEPGGDNPWANIYKYGAQQ